MDDVHIGIGSFAESDIQIRFSDFTNYVNSMGIGEPDPGRTDLTCSWWGSAGGPVSAGAPDPSVFTPWATAPVAGTSTATCSGGL